MASEEEVLSLASNKMNFDLAFAEYQDLEAAALELMAKPPKDKTVGLAKLQEIKKGFQENEETIKGIVEMTLAEIKQNPHCDEARYKYWEEHCSKLMEQFKWSGGDA